MTAFVHELRACPGCRSTWGVVYCGCNAWLLYWDGDPSTTPSPQAANVAPACPKCGTTLLFVDVSASVVTEAGQRLNVEAGAAVSAVDGVRGN